MTRWEELLSRKPPTPPTRYFVAKRAGRLHGRLFSEGALLKVVGETRVDATMLHQITETEWQEKITENQLRLAEMFPEAGIYNDTT